MILLYAGRRPGSADFPESNVPFVGEQIEQLLGGLNPRLVVGSAAAGADLLVLEAAERRGIAAEIILAGGRADFRAGSVEDKGEPWVRRYEHQLDRPGVSVVELAEGASEAGYRAVTRRIAERGRELAGADEAIAVLAVSVDRGAGADHSAELAQEGNAPGRLLVRIDPARARDATPTAFIAMPYRVKPYAERGWTDYDADQTYSRVILPALVDAGYRPMRADSDALLQVIDHTMLRAISAAPLMLVDLAMLNANVMWELGVRHAWRRSGTILIAPEWLTAPFDVKRAPVYSYRREEQSVGDADAVAAIRVLQDVLRSVALKQVDSPVFANVNELPETVVPEPPGSAAETAGALLSRVTLAADRRDDAALVALAATIEASGIPAGARVALLEQIGFRLVALDRYAEARRVLEPLAAEDEALDRRVLQQQYAHVLIRQSGDAEARDEGERLLEALRARYGPDPETLGLLGSAAKARIEAAVARQEAPAAATVAGAIAAYRDGLTADPRAYYPGINAVALLRLRGQHWNGPPEDLAEARELLPVVRFAARRTAAHDVWAQLTLAECDLHQHLLDGDPAALERARSAYAAAVRRSPMQTRSGRRQLELLRDAGDPVDVIQPLIELLS